ncbi:MAG: DUF2256 domain-containing protein [Planctomycetes bacterium]|nr:DUF2256 domain-containing protein [Planctomycetota bacterium]MBL6910412.1 DUF2256 domain-containing protein [Pirellulales bacterium]RZO66282.1 MAG: DUF2256 domain-containing protein [Phycisphaeraceae bacterium]HAO73265.1 DUF2256 domain-containing protein [Planctomycetaceae bacterium]MBL7181842.1 DUF2256 domain-containing protein [Pirellulales bacterium]
MSSTTPPRCVSRKGTYCEKICAVCGRPFSWRKKWENCWPNVRYCSARCRRQKKSGS